MDFFGIVGYKKAKIPTVGCFSKILKIIVLEGGPIPHILSPQAFQYLVPFAHKNVKCVIFMD